MISVLLPYLIKLVIASGLFYLYYLAALRDRSFHSFNRFYLLLAFPISCIIPLINFDVHFFPLHHSIQAISGRLDITVSPQQLQLNHLNSIIPLLISFVSFILLLVLAVKIFMIIRLAKTSLHYTEGNIVFVCTDHPKAPFSIFSFLFWKQGIAVDDINSRRIIAHEKAHIVHYHSYDRIFAQIVSCLFWMNPFFWMMQQELMTVHEFLADEASVPKGDSEAFAAMILSAYDGGSFLNPSHHLINSQIKRRFTMISSNTPSGNAGIRRSLALVVFFVALISLGSRSGAQPGFPISDFSQLRVDTVPASTNKDIVVKGYRMKNASPSTSPASRPEPGVKTVVGYRMKKNSDKKTDTLKSF